MSLPARDCNLARLMLDLLREDWTAVESKRSLVERAPHRFVDLVESCELTVWFHSRMAATGNDGILGERVGRAFAARRRRCARDNLLLLAQVERILGPLEKAGIRPIALKGLDTLHRFYDRFDQRTLDDVDLLIRRSELPRVLDVLKKEGFRQLAADRRAHYLATSHHLPMYSPGPQPILFEWHWNLVQDERYRLDPEDLIARAKPLQIGEHQILRLENHDLAGHLLLHHLAHYFDKRMKWALDLRHVSGEPDFDWRIVAERIRQWGARTTAAASMVHLHKLVPDWIPEDAARCFPLSFWRRALLRPLRSDHPLELFRDTRQRQTQLLLASLLYEQPARLPAWIWNRWRRPTSNSENR